MNILAIHQGHCATAAIFEKDHISAVLSEEKINNIKNSWGYPKGAIEAILEMRGLKPDDIDHVAIAGTDLFPNQFYDHLMNQDVKHFTSSWLYKQFQKVDIYSSQSVVSSVVDFFRKRRVTKRIQHWNNIAIPELLEGLQISGLQNTPRSFIDHYKCHAASAYYALNPQGNSEPALVFTLDGGGDGLCATVSVVDGDGSWKVLAKTPVSASLGIIYLSTTEFLGMKILEHEHKVMGLASYCKDYHMDVFKRVFEPVIDLDYDNPLVFKSKIRPGLFYDHLVKNAVGERFDNIAGAVQLLVEDRVVRWIKAAVKKTGINRIFTAGGVFMNVKLNQRIAEIDEVHEAHFLPSCGDESNPLGAAYVIACEKKQEIKPIENLYLGFEFSNNKLDKYIQENGLTEKYNVKFYEDVEKEIASLLSDREIVARFSGKCEWGARALGNRSILAHPSHIESFYTVNDLIKCRDFWMPFAPTILDTKANEYLNNYNPKCVKAPYMTLTYSASEIGLTKLRAAVHQGDHTLRPQVLTRDMNPNYYYLISEFEKKTGVGAVLNTSFNLHGYPLVGTPEQAVMTFENSGLQHLALGSFIISKIV